MRFPLRVYTRIALELTAPCAIGSGEGSTHSDQPFVVDFNQLPTLPGTALAGMLRAAFRRASSATDEHGAHGARDDDWFGYQDGDEGRSSRVRLSWGHIHDQDDRPVEGLVVPDEQSEFLRDIARGTLRDHVRISHLGTAAETGKFDRTVVFEGARFTFDLEIVGSSDESLKELVAIRDELLGLLQSPTTRLGGATQSGMGDFKVIHAASGAFDLRDFADFQAFCAIPVRLDEPSGLPALRLPEPLSADAACVEVSLQPETFFLIGGGEPDAQQYPDATGAPKINPVRKQRIRWKRASAALESRPNLYIPATAIKGALSHRVAFHYNRRAGSFVQVDQDPAELEMSVGERNPAVRTLFGYCKNSRRDDGDGAAGKLILNDVDLSDYEPHQRKLMHTSIDSFTGGVRGRMLFGEQALSPNGPAIKFRILVKDVDAIDATTRQSLHDALSDLVSGRLALGSGAGRGNGRFRGNFTWPDELSFAAGDDASRGVSAEVKA